MHWKGQSVWENIQLLMDDKSIASSDVLKTYIRDMVEDITFAELHEKTGWVLCINVTDGCATNQQIFCNYLSTPNMLVWSASVASCSIPGIYDKSELMMKNNKG